MNKKGRAGKTIWIIIILLLLLLGWGLVGASQADDVGVTCEMGVGEESNLCWIWSKNVIGEINEGLEDIGDGGEDNPGDGY